MESPKGLAVDSSCKLILAVVRPHLVESLLDGLKLAPIEALTIKEVKGFGRQKNMLDQYSGDDFNLAFLPKVELSIWVDALRLEEVLELIESLCKTGRMGDGKIMVVAEP
ncbi:MAG: P-II family nitrogen regulator [Planctomycetota bacterium]|jgi:nitrogen regulatory protein P-II 1